MLIIDFILTLDYNQNKKIQNYDSYYKNTVATAL